MSSIKIHYFQTYLHTTSTKSQLFRNLPIYPTSTFEQFLEINEGLITRFSVNAILTTRLKAVWLIGIDTEGLDRGINNTFTTGPSD